MSKKRSASEPISLKAEYVKSQKQNRPHHCHWPGCKKQCPPACWGCKDHWYTLPKHIRNRIWYAYRPGQEKDMHPSKAYLEAATAAQEWIKAYLERPGDEG